MMFFIHHVQTYKNVNRKGQEMCEFAQAYDRILVQDECAMAVSYTHLTLPTICSV